MNYETLSVAFIDTEEVVTTTQKVTKVDVVQSRTIKVEDTFYMVPSQGYAGIELGTVEVLAIGNTEQLYSDTSLDKEVASSVGMFVRNDLDAYDPSTTDYYERQEVLMHGLWVVYRYQDCTIDGLYAFPIEEFLEHSVRMV